MKRYLTKSRFKLGLECPTKLFYTKKSAYANQQLDDPFLKALAEGGFQVGELAKRYFPGGHEVSTLEADEALAQTNALLAQDQVVIYEPAIAFENLFIRVDILVKNGQHLDLIEVKAKSYDVEHTSFLKANGSLLAAWKPYLYDVAFQKHVLQSAFSGFTVNAFLMMTDKTAVCQTEGLNQKFKIVRGASGRTGVSVSGRLAEEDLDRKILIQVPVDDAVERILSGADAGQNGEISFLDRVALLSDHYARDERLFVGIGGKCKTCEFTCSAEDEKSGLKSGFKTCWKEELGWSDADFEAPTVLDVWACTKKDELIAQGKVKMKDLVEADIDVKETKDGSLSRTQRQWLQIEKVKNQDPSPYFDKVAMKAAYDSWTYPLHFIDFETSQVAIPFNKGRRPYEGIAFQFSHHTVHQDGSIEHAGQYINTEQGQFPNYDFVRALRKALGDIPGTIFRYAAHENSYLNMIYHQLQSDQSEIADRDALCAFIQSITTSTGKSEQSWQGPRNMVDMLELVKKYYYDPAMGGSNSIKQVLPAILNHSTYLQTKYAQPIYGTPVIPSKNFQDWTWIQWQGDTVKDPYKLLPPMFENITVDQQDLLTQDNDLNNGGAAMSAYARIQFSEIIDVEKVELTQALLKYCELDTLAMVMIYEGWREVL